MSTRFFSTLLFPLGATFVAIGIGMVRSGAELVVAAMVGLFGITLLAIAVVILPDGNPGARWRLVILLVAVALLSAACFVSFVSMLDPGSALWRNPSADTFFVTSIIGGVVCLAGSIAVAVLLVRRTLSLRRGRSS